MNCKNKEIKNKEVCLLKFVLVSFCVHHLQFAIQMKMIISLGTHED